MGVIKSYIERTKYNDKKFMEIWEKHADEISEQTQIYMFQGLSMKEALDKAYHYFLHK